MQPSFGHAQIAAHGNRGDIQGLGDFFHGESAEIAEFDGFAFSRVELFEGIQTSVEGQEVSTAFGLKTDGFIERHFEPSALTGLLAARVVHQNLAHESGSHSKEMRAALPGGIALIDKPYVSLVNERGWLQSMALVFLAQVASGQQKGHFVGFGHGPRVENGTLPSWADYTPPSLPGLSFAR
jgi:hypothetical protein